MNVKRAQKTKKGKAGCAARRQAGNAMVALFGVVTVVATIGVSATMLMRGPIKTMSDVNQTTMADGNAVSAMKMVLIDAGNLASPDCDSDKMTEARPWRTHADNGPDDVVGSDGGGFLPNEIGALKRDPWGTQFGYCVWDHGSLVDNAGCGGAAQNRLAGGNTADYPALAIISAGPNATFDTGCMEWVDADTNGIPDTALITPTGDDIVITYSYAEAAQESPSVWELDVDTASGAIEAKLSTSAEFSGSESAFGGKFEMKGSSGLLLPDEVQLPTCDGSTEGQVRRNMSGTTPILELCETGVWETVSGGAVGSGGGTTPDPGPGDPSKAYSWGTNNSESVLGDGGTSNQHTPVLAENLPGDMVNVSISKHHGCVVRESGEVNCWGNGAFGRLGNGGTANSSTPVTVSDITNFSQIATGTNHTCGLTLDNNIYCWGDDSSGAVGNGGGSDGNVTTPQAIANNGGFIQIDSGHNFSCGLKSDNTVWCWGEASKGRLGNNDDVNDQFSPVQVANVTNFVQVSTGRDYACGATTGGQGYCWGNNDNGVGSGVLGDGTQVQSNVPVQISTVTNFVKVEAGSVLSCGLTTDAEIWCWGDSYIGSGSYSDSNVPAKVANIDGFKDVDVGAETGCGLRTNGLIWCWSDDTNGMLGDNDTLTSMRIPNELATSFPIQKIRMFPGDETDLVSNVIALAAAGEDYIAQATVTQTGSAGSTIGSAGWVNILASDTAGQQAGVAFNLDINPGKSDTPIAAITAIREADPGQGGLAFKTYQSGFLRDRMYLSWLGSLGLDITAGDSTKHYARLQHGDHYGAGWNSTYSKGLLFTQNDAATTNQLGYFGFEGDNDADAAILFSKDLKIVRSDVEAKTANESVRFDSTLKTTFTGNVSVQDSASSVKLRHQSYSNAAADSPDLAFHRTRGESSNQSATAGGDILGSVKIRAYDGSALPGNGQAAIWSEINGAVGANDVPADIVIGIDSAGDAMANEKMRITSAGNVGVGTSAPVTKLHSGARILSEKGVRIGAEADGNCAVAADANTLRYTGDAADPYEYCDGDSWEPLKEGSGIACSPIPFDIRDVTNIANNTLYTTEEFLVGGLDNGCPLTVATDSSEVTIVHNGVDQAGTIVTVFNGDRIALKIRSGNGENLTVKTYISIGDKTDEVRVTTLPAGYFVLSSGAYNGDLGGLEGADAKCYTDVTANNWLNKGSAGTITPGRVKAFLCDSDVCNNLQPNTKYYFAISGDAVNGGDSFTTDSLAQGPGDANNWSVATKFNGAFGYWAGRQTSSSTLWDVIPADVFCLGWTSNNGTDFGNFGAMNATDSSRWKSGVLSCNASIGSLICAVHPE